MKIVNTFITQSSDGERVLYDSREGGIIEIVLSNGKSIMVAEGEGTGDEPVFEIHSADGLAVIYPRAANAFWLKISRR
jgi:hypothetical protein